MALTPPMKVKFYADHSVCANFTRLNLIALKADGFLEMIRFHSRLILNADEADVL